MKEGYEEFRITLVLSIHFDITVSDKNGQYWFYYFSNHDLSSLTCVCSLAGVEASLCCGRVLVKAGKAYQVKMLALFEDPYILETNYTHLNDAMHTFTYGTSISAD